MKTLLFISFWLGALTSCSTSHAPDTQFAGNTSSEQTYMQINNSENLDKATFGAGCFWCVEAVYQQLEGVVAVESGYAGGEMKNPTYKEICTGKTGHAEVIQITYDANVTSYSELLDVFWRTHDPTTLNRQGNDSGTQYRSVIFYHNEAQKRIAEASMAAASEAKIYDDPIVTEISPLSNYSKAEDYHQDYFKNNPNQPYCFYVVGPKVDKFQKLFKDKLKAGVK